MKWFAPRKDKTGNDLSSRDTRGLLNLISKHLAEIAEDLNGNLQDDSLKLVVSNPVSTLDPDGDRRIETTRIQVCNKVSGLSIRARHNLIELFILPSQQLYLVPATEYPSRLKFKLEKRDGQTWLLDGQESSESDLKLLMLTVTNDLLKHSAKGAEATAPGARLRIGDLSLTTGLRDLLFEKAQLLCDLVDRQELVKAELSADLHDSVIADLLFLKRELAEKKDIPVERVCSALEEVVQNLRDICAEMSARELKNWGLGHSLAELCERMSQKSGQAIEFRATENTNPQLAYDASLHIYRIAQEVLNNALKHARAKTITLCLTVENKELTLSIKDDGIGFSALPPRPSKDGGMGIPILNERTEMLTTLGYRSVISLVSLPNEGTTVTLSVDLSTLANNNSLT